MSSFSYVDGLSNSNEKMLQMRANLLNNREGLVNGRITSQPSSKLLDKIKVFESPAPKKNHMEIFSSKERDFKYHMREALSSFKI